MDTYTDFKARGFETANLMQASYTLLEHVALLYHCTPPRRGQRSAAMHAAPVCLGLQQTARVCIVRFN